MTISTPTGNDVPHLDFAAPVGLRTRGTVIIVAGRGETPTTYQRLGARLAADAYRVRVITAPALDEADLSQSLARFAATLTVAVAGADGDQPARPLVLIGSDTGAAALGALVGRNAVDQAPPDAGWWPQALVLAALPGYTEHPIEDWNEELEVRTSCPAHRGVLNDDPALQRGKLSGSVPSDLLDAVYGSTVELPQLLLIGDADPLADQEALTRAAKALPASRLISIRRAHHDVLNDLQHRSVAAEIVTFLESLRNEPSLEPIVDVLSSSW